MIAIAILPTLSALGFSIYIGGEFSELLSDWFLALFLIPAIAISWGGVVYLLFFVKPPIDWVLTVLTAAVTILMPWLLLVLLPIIALFVFW